MVSDLVPVPFLGCFLLALQKTHFALISVFFFLNIETLECTMMFWSANNTFFSLMFL